MLIVSLPKNALEAQCPINGEQCDVRIENKTLAFRAAGQTEWDRRPIFNATSNDAYTMYICGSTG